MIILPMKLNSSYSVTAVSAAAGYIDYYLSYSREYQSPRPRSTTSTLTHKYLSQYLYRRIAQRFNVLQLLVVLPQLLRHDHLHLQVLFIMPILDTLALAARLTA